MAGRRGRQSPLDRPALEAVAEAIPHIVWLSDVTGWTDYFNERGTDYTGFPRQANYGWRWVELVHPDDAERARLGWEHATRSATPFELSYRIRRNDGVYRWHAFRALPVRGDANEIIRWIGTADDVTKPSPLDDATRVERQIVELRAMLDAVRTVPSENFGFVRPEELSRRVNEAVAREADSRDVRPAPTAPPGSESPVLEGLERRDLAVVRLVAAGHTNAEIANLLGFSLRTIEASRARVRRALGLRSRADLVRFAFERGLTGNEPRGAG